MAASFIAGVGFEKEYHSDVAPNYIEVPVVVEIPTHIKTLQVIKEIGVVEIPTYPEPKQFNSIMECKSWMSMQDICRREYRHLYDCDDFALDLVMAAMKDGYIIGLCSSTRHMQCFTIIGNMMYKIEPQNYHIAEWGLVDEEGNENAR